MGSNYEERSKGENMQTTLLIMAAGIGSRFGSGIKQLEKVDKNGHIIMDYSIHDAIETGFNKIVFIIRKDIEAELMTFQAHCRRDVRNRGEQDRQFWQQKIF